jgi:hypothetical protein
MKRMMIACAFLFAAAAGRQAVAQEHGEGDRPDRKERVERMERLKQMRMIETLDLGEDDAVRFMAKRKEHEDRIKGLAEERNSLLDELQEQLGPPPGGRGEGKPGGKPDGRQESKPGAKPDAKPDAKSDATPEAKPDIQLVEKDVARILDQDRKIFDERKRYQDEMKKMLGDEKFAKMLLFERDFQMQVRDAMGRSMNRRSGKFDE